MEENNTVSQRTKMGWSLYADMFGQSTGDVKESNGNKTK